MVAGLGSLARGARSVRAGGAAPAADGAARVPVASSQAHGPGAARRAHSRLHLCACRQAGLGAAPATRAPRTSTGAGRLWSSLPSIVPSAAKGFLRELQELKSEAESSSDSAASAGFKRGMGSSSQAAPKGMGSSSKGGRKVSLEFEPPLSIVRYPSPVLRAENAEVTSFSGKNKSSLELLAAEMFRVMYATEGIGLAAPQVGVNVKMMVYNPEGEPDKGEEVVLVNPRVLESSRDTCDFEEGCLSFPQIYADVTRPKRVVVEAQDLEGKTYKLKLEGLQARVFQHEYDHLEGVLFHDRMTQGVRRGVLKDLLALEDAFKAEYPAVSFRSAAKK